MNHKTWKLQPNVCRLCDKNIYKICLVNSTKTQLLFQKYAILKYLKFQRQKSVFRENWTKDISFLKAALVFCGLLICDFAYSQK